VARRRETVVSPEHLDVAYLGGRDRDGCLHGRGCTEAHGRCFGQRPSQLGSALSGPTPTPCCLRRGAGLAAVYNVPLAGALFTAEILFGTFALPVILAAVACSCIATATAWLYLPTHATTSTSPDYRMTMTLLVWALLVGPVIGVMSSDISGSSVGSRTTGRPAGASSSPCRSSHRARLDRPRVPAAVRYGKDMAHSAFLGQGGLVLLFALFALKPLVTALCLGSGGRVACSPPP